MPYVNLTLCHHPSHVYNLCAQKPRTLDETGFRKQHRSHTKAEEDALPHFLKTKPSHIFISDYLYLWCTSKEQKLMTWMEVHNRRTQLITLTTSSILKVLKNIYDFELGEEIPDQKVSYTK
jgi:hypothetical protein